MGPKEDRSHFNGNSANANSLSSTNDGGDMERNSSSCLDNEKEGNIAVCRVCQCAESDKGGEAALGFLDITPPLSHMPSKEENNLHVVASGIDANGSIVHSSDSRSESKFIKFLSPDGKVFICSEDIEAGAYLHHDKLIDLGCSCKNDLSLAHYACALKWFISRGSTVCEICSTVAKNVRFADVKKVVASLNDYESLRERTATGELSPAHVPANSNVDPDAVAAIRRQRLSEISLWFNPQSNNSTGVVISQGITDQSSTNPVEDAAHVENTTTKWAVESTGILVATGLLTITLAWLIAPRVGKKTAKSGLHILLGGICALTVVIFLRFIVLSRIKYGPARYWAILFVFWFLVFGIWASRTHSAHTT